MSNAKENDKSISVIIVTYNAADTLQACLDSIYRQTYPKLQIIVMDGASVDGTIDILKANSNRITFWKTEPDKGIYHAMNKALNHVKTDWIYFIGADDELLPEFSAMAAQLDNTNCIYYGNVLVQNEKNGGPTNALTHTMHNICQQAMIYPAWVFKKYRYDTTYPIAADYALNIRCWADKSLEFCYQDLTIANYNHTGISSVIKDERFEKDRLKLVFRYHGFKMWRKLITRRWKEIRQSRKI
ncbi:glycosyltransferase family 2 protein [Mucilaginibacter celer]|uniref:Glycosyltransferase n=1 Tax=Mucilaginibacter celer TaxID=2305508 RepID=A0A494VGT6_9SPHI|nr:glycosyltransferase family 2 protein [Mucilaginibacter celer]AYL93787.1 glycosyltransferase [Mucilaginibacter celer]